MARNLLVITLLLLIVPTFTAPVGGDDDNLDFDILFDESLDALLNDPFDDRATFNGDIDLLQIDAKIDNHEESRDDEIVPPPPKPSRKVPQDSDSLQIFMDRSIKTVPDLWQEWHKGINGRPAMKSIRKVSQSVHGIHCESERVFRRVRRNIIEYTEKVRDEGKLTDSEAVELVEAERNQLKLGLSSFGDYCRNYLNKPTPRYTRDDGSKLLLMDRSTQTVPLLWKEWHEGINGKPPMKSADRSFGTLGWNYAAEHKFVKRRKVILEYVDSVMSEYGLSAEDAVNRVEAERNSKGLKLHAFGQQLTAPTPRDLNATVKHKRKRS